jgi:beta-phosphoglucomutase-like phosphatase (HAD superfamily)
MTPNPVALDAALRYARHLVFAFNGPILSADAGGLTDLTAPTAPYIYEAFTACRESGRSVVVISAKPPIDEPAYLDAHGLFTQITVLAGAVDDAIDFLETTPAACLLVTSSPADIQAAQAAGIPSIGYARPPDTAAQLIEAGAATYVYSIADIALSLREHGLDL